MGHSFYIPVLGLAFTVDTPLKVAKYGISSVVSIVDDELLERMRAFYAEKEGVVYRPIAKHAEDGRAKRITAYLNLLDELVRVQFENLKKEGFGEGKEADRYFAYLPENSVLRQRYLAMQQAEELCERQALQQQLLKDIPLGSIDVNIMSKVDKANRALHKSLPEKYYSDAMAALRGYAQSGLMSSLVLSAGLNPHLYSYLSTFDDFFPTSEGVIRKKVVLKVSDYRSAYVQAKFLAKKGIWVSEFRVESGLNCGGHAFATEGHLLGPILEEFKQQKVQLHQELYALLSHALHNMGRVCPETLPLRITAQGGVGTSAEHAFLLEYYQLDGVGWGSPFLLVPEVTNVDAFTLQELVDAVPGDYYVSNASPLGVPFNNFRRSSAEQQRIDRIKAGVPGSPCTKKYLVSNTEFTQKPICTASRTYQRLKIRKLQSSGLTPEAYLSALEKVLEKTCLCQGLSSSALLVKGLLTEEENRRVAICPGPNLIWFKGIYSLAQMLDHIYGRHSLINGGKRPSLLTNELQLYIDHLQKYIEAIGEEIDEKAVQYIGRFRQELQNGIAYYQDLLGTMGNKYASVFGKLGEELADMGMQISCLRVKNNIEA